jgi:hypothetical protein
MIDDSTFMSIFDNTSDEDASGRGVVARAFIAGACGAEGTLVCLTCWSRRQKSPVKVTEYTTKETVIF